MMFALLGAVVDGDSGDSLGDGSAGRRGGAPLTKEEWAEIRRERHQGKE